jgi:hypothetical protein
MHTQVIKDDAIKSPDFAVNCKIDPSTDQPQFLQLTAKNGIMIEQRRGQAASGGESSSAGTGCSNMPVTCSPLSK